MRRETRRENRQRHEEMIANPIDAARSTGREEVVTTKAYTVEEVADMFQIGRDKVYALLRTGELNSIKIGKLRRITEAHVAEFVAALEEKEHDLS